MDKGKFWTKKYDRCAGTIIPKPAREPMENFLSKPEAYQRFAAVQTFLFQAGSYF